MGFFSIITWIGSLRFGLPNWRTFRTSNPWAVSSSYTSSSEVLRSSPLTNVLSERSSGRLNVSNSVSVMVRYFWVYLNIPMSTHYNLICSRRKVLEIMLSSGTVDMSFLANFLLARPCRIIIGILGALGWVVSWLLPFETVSGVWFGTSYINDRTGGSVFDGKVFYGVMEVVFDFFFFFAVGCPCLISSRCLSRGNSSFP